MLLSTQLPPSAQAEKTQMFSFLQDSDEGANASVTNWAASVNYMML